MGLSRNNVREPRGVYLVHSKHVDQYVERYRPQCLRSTIASGKEFALDFMNFKVSKGATFERVMRRQAEFEIISESWFFYTRVADLRAPNAVPG
jgi:hypothetical protein